MVAMTTMTMTRCPMTTPELLDGLGEDTDLARLVHRVGQERLPWVVVSSGAIAGWMRRDPKGWQKVSDWLTEQGDALMQIWRRRSRAGALHERLAGNVRRMADGPS